MKKSKLYEEAFAVHDLLAKKKLEESTKIAKELRETIIEQLKTTGQARVDILTKKKLREDHLEEMINYFRNEGFKADVKEWYSYTSATRYIQITT